MYKKNEIRSGFIVGFLTPLVGLGVFYLLFAILEGSGLASQEGFKPNFRIRTVFLIGICLNLIPMRVFYRKRFLESMRGVVLATFLFAVIWIILFRETFF